METFPSPRLALAILGIAAMTPDAAGQDLRGSPCTIARIVDGDTLVCAGGERVRLLLIDAPEIDQGPFGRAAQAFLEALLPIGSEARLETDVDRRDRYGRLLAYAFRFDGRMVNRLMARQGFAVPYVVPPNVRHVETIRAAADSARALELGLWAIEAFECAPEAFRRGACARGSGGAGPGRPESAPAAGPAATREGCDPSYPDVCIPPSPPDLDCRDVPHRRFRVVGADPHRFDGDGNGLGCERTS